MGLLEVKNLVTEFTTDEGRARAVAGISFKIEGGKTLALVGESGCGKSMTALSLMRLVPKPGLIAEGQILYKGQDLVQIPEKEMRKIRGRSISMIFQEPMTSLNPLYTCGNQVAEVIKLHFPELSRQQVWSRAVEMLELVGIPEAKRRAEEYPHQLSGGMRQRVMIAMAMACSPELLIADEPTTALDVTIQAQILDLIKKLQKEKGMSLLLITHDLGVVAEMCEQMAVMYAGKIVEVGATREIFKAPKHPYTQGLLNSIPDPRRTTHKSILSTIPGLVPNLFKLPKGCRFQDRCSKVQAKCREQEPGLSWVTSKPNAGQTNAGQTNGGQSQAGALGNEVACFFPTISNF